MGSVKVTEAAGLYVSDNLYDSVPKGSMSTADNVVIRNKNIVEPRRGWDERSITLPNDNGGTPVAHAYAEELASFGGKRFIHGLAPMDFNAPSTDNPVLFRDDGSSFAAIFPGEAGTAGTTYEGGVSNPATSPDADLLRTKFVEAQRQLYFTTTQGICRVESVDEARFDYAGVMEPYEIRGDSSVAISTTVPIAGAPNATGSWLPADSSVSYRAVMGYRDAYGHVRLSAPTGRMVVYNPPANTIALGAMSRTSGVVTATTGSVHAFRVGEQFSLVAVGSADANYPAGTYTIASVPSPTSFTYVQGSGTTAVSTSSYTITPGAKYTAFSFLLPPAARLGHFFQLYRTEYTRKYNIDPGDEHFLVYEKQLTSAELTFQTLDIADKTPEDYLSATPLYSNPDTGEGIDASKRLPPFAKDICLLNDRLWAGNIEPTKSIEIQFLGVGAPDGIQQNDLLVVSVDGFATVFGFTAPGVSAPSNTFPVTYFNTGTPSQNSVNTAKAFVHAFNSGVYNARAKYISADNDAFGKVLIERVRPGIRDYGYGTPATNDIYIAATRPASFQPVPETAYKVSAVSGDGTTVTVTTSSAHGYSTGDVVDVDSLESDLDTATITVTGATTFTFPSSLTSFPFAVVVFKRNVKTDETALPNGIAYSSLQEVEAFPPLNYLTVGAENHPILRIAPLRDKLFVLKTDGVYTVSGEYPFRVDQLDSTTFLTAPDSLQVVANRIVCLTNRGVVQITDAGVTVISGPIERLLRPLVSNATAEWKRSCFAVAYETEQQYQLWLPSSEVTDFGRYYCDQAYVFNFLSGTWTRFAVNDASEGYLCGKVLPNVDDKLHLGLYDRENKTFSDGDHYDYSATYTVASSTATTATFSGLPGDHILRVGGYFDRNGTSKGTITDVNGSTITFLNESATPPPAGNATVYMPFAASVVYNPQTGGEPGTWKHVREVTMHFGFSSRFENGAITTQCELNDTAVSDTIRVPGTLFHNASRNIPRQHQRAAEVQVGLTVTNAARGWRLLGHTLTGEGGSEKVSRG